jgi:hypothetical protein
LSAVFTYTRVRSTTRRLPYVHFVAAGSSVTEPGVGVVVGAAPAFGVGFSFDELIFVSFYSTTSDGIDEP